MIDPCADLESELLESIAVYPLPGADGPTVVKGGRPNADGSIIARAGGRADADSPIVVAGGRAGADEPRIVKAEGPDANRLRQADRR